MQWGEPTLCETKREDGGEKWGRGEGGESAFMKQQGVEKWAIGEKEGLKERKKDRKKKESTEAALEEGKMQK